MKGSVIGEIQKLRQMSVSELQAAWMRLYHEPTRSRNKQFLFRRLAWRLQEIAHGGLSDRARDRIDHLAPDGFTRARTPNQAIPVADPGPQRDRQPARDPRLPAVGTVIAKHYKGRELRVVVHEEGLELDGVMYGSATALARAITGSKSINGLLFLGIVKRRR